MPGLSLRHTARLMAAALSLVMIGCGGDVTPPDAPATEVAEPTAIPLTPTPTPFKERLVLCSVGPAADVLTGRRYAERAIREMLFPPPVIFAADYTAEVDPALTLLTALPDPNVGTLQRADEGRLIVTLAYRQDLTWSDGEPFDAADAALGLGLPAPAGMPRFEVLSVEQVDDFTLRVTAAPGAEYPYVPFQPPLPAHALGEGFNPADFAVSDYAQALQPALGAYQLASREGDLLLEANPHYAPASAMPRVTLRTLADADQAAAEINSGGCDAVLENDITPASLAAVESASVRTALRPGPIREQLIFNTYPGLFSDRLPFFADARVRRAAAHAINRQALIEAGLGAGDVLETWLPPDHWAASDQSPYPAYDPAAAAALLDEAGWADADGDGIREATGQAGEYACFRGSWAVPQAVEEEPVLLRPVLLTPAGDAARTAAAEAIRADLAVVGIDVVVEAVEPEALYALGGPAARRQFDLLLLAGQARPDPAGIESWVGADIFIQPNDGTFVHFWNLEDRWRESDQLVERVAFDNTPSPETDFTGQNFAGWCSELGNITTVAAVRAFTITEKAPAYAQQQQVLAEEVPALPLANRPLGSAWRGYVCGPEPRPFAPLTWNISHWTFDPTETCSGAG